MKIAQIVSKDSFGDYYYYINDNGDIKYVVWEEVGDEICFVLCDPNAKSIHGGTFMSCLKTHSSFNPEDALEALSYELMEPKVACCIGENYNKHKVYILLQNGVDNIVVAIPSGSHLGFHKIRDKKGDTFNPIPLFYIETLEKAGFEIVRDPDLFKQLIEIEFTGEQHLVKSTNSINEKSFEERMREKTNKLFRTMW